MSGKKDDIFSGISDISFDSVMGGSSKKAAETADRPAKNPPKKKSKRDEAEWRKFLKELDEKDEAEKRKRADLEERAKTDPKAKEELDLERAFEEFDKKMLEDGKKIEAWKKEEEKKKRSESAKEKAEREQSAKTRDAFFAMLESDSLEIPDDLDEATKKSLQDFLYSPSKPAVSAPPEDVKPADEFEEFTDDDLDAMLASYEEEEQKKSKKQTKKAPETKESHKQTILPAEDPHPVCSKPKSSVSVAAKELSLSKTLEAFEKEERKSGGNLCFPLGVKDNGKSCFVTFSADNAPIFIVRGSAGTGKTNFLKSLVLSASAACSPKIINFFIGDTADNCDDFSCFDESKSSLFVPQVTGIMYAERGNGLIEFLSHVEDEIERRKRLFAVSGVSDIAAYNKVASEPLPVTFFVLDDLLKNLALLKDILWLYNPTIERFCEFLRVSKPLGISFALSGDADYSGEFARMLRSCGREVVSVCLKGCAKYGFCGGDNTGEDKSILQSVDEAPLGVAAVKGNGKPATLFTVPHTDGGEAKVFALSIRKKFKEANGVTQSVYGNKK